MFFGSWAIATGVICLIGFTAMMIMSFSETGLQTSVSEEENTES